MKFNLNLEDIKYVKILYKDKNNNPCTKKGAIKIVNNREFIACVKFEDELSIITPQEVTLSLICNDGLYRTKTNLKVIEQAEPYIFFVLETPHGLEYQQNREYFRVLAQFECIYSVNKGTKIREYHTHTYDISANGVSIVIPVLEVTEEDAEIEMSIENIKINSKIKYVRSEKTENGYKISFTYTKISNLDRDFISQVCIKKQLEQKRHSLK